MDHRTPPPVGAEIPHTIGDMLTELNITWPCSKQALLKQVQQGPYSGLTSRASKLPVLSQIPDREYRDAADVEREFIKVAQSEIGRGPYADQ
ncbi:DUF2795 domain-containing protein [Streptomyces sp. NPDC052415]|uniref:DUF2795 domain-containing protein n=1 Tax=Streptomyces sp. NPDC052415 TaxID=3365690 RepID=UPI0037D72805